MFVRIKKVVLTKIKTDSYHDPWHRCLMKYTENNYMLPSFTFLQYLFRKCAIVDSKVRN